MSVTRSLDDTQPIPVVRGRHAATKSTRSRGRRTLVILREAGLVAAFVAVVAIGARLTLGQVAYVADDAMAPSFVAGERVLVSPLGDAQPGDVVLVPSHTAWGTPSSEALVRVVALGNQQVACCDDDGRITVNGAALDEPYLAGRTDQVEFDVTVPDGRVFVLVDDRSKARDSRVLLEADQGTVDVQDIRGRVIAVLWPPRAIGD